MDQGFSSSFDVYHARTDYASLILVPRARVFAISGSGLPSSGYFAYASAVLRDLALELRQLLARRGLRARKPYLEVLWSSPEPGRIDQDEFRDRSNWTWQQMTRLPLALTDSNALDALQQISSRAGREAPLAHLSMLESAPAAQMLHVGGWQTQAVTLSRLLDNLAAAGIEAVDPVHVVRVADDAVVPASRAASILRVRMEHGLVS